MSEDKGYLAYQDMISGTDDEIKEVRQKVWEKCGITKKDFSWKGKSNDGFATVYLKYNVPFHINWYVWDISDENLISNLSKDLGIEIELFDCYGGNGHYSGSIRVVKTKTLSILIEEEYGFKFYKWAYPGTREDLILDWQDGKVPAGIGWLPTNKFKGKIEEVNYPTGIELGLDFNKPEDLLKLKDIWAEFNKKFDARCHLFHMVDSWLEFYSDKKDYRWSYDKDNCNYIIV